VHDDATKGEAVSQAAAHAHDHEHPPFLAHHWETPKQQFEAGKLGMWLFLATEVLLFGGLFCGYTIWRFQHPEMFRFGSTFLDTKWGAINTAVLITSSLTMAAAVTLAQRGKQGAMLLCLVLTLGGALGFLGIKYIEYTHKFHEGFFPGVRFYQKPAHAETWDAALPAAGVANTPIDTAVGAPTAATLGLPSGATVELPAIAPPREAPAGVNLSTLTQLEHEYAGGSGAHHKEHPEHPRHPLQDPERPANAHMFFNIYFMMTGLHGFHVLAGAIVIVWLIIGALRGRFGPDYFTPVDLGGLYWHVVDLIWIFLFPLFYLI
jgi:cytochrome c oxidase subunit 3